MSTSFQLVSCKMFIAFLWSKSKRCFVSLLCACFSSVSFLQKQGNSISNLYLIWTNDEFVKQKSLHSLDERLSLVCLHFTLFTLRFFTQWNQFQNLYFKLTFVRLHEVLFRQLSPSYEASQNDVSFYSSVPVSRQCLFFRDKVTVFLIYTWFEHITRTWNWTKISSLSWWGAVASLLSFYLVYTKIFHPVKQISKSVLLINLSFVRLLDCAVLVFARSCVFALM